MFALDASRYVGIQHKACHRRRVPIQYAAIEQGNFVQHAFVAQRHARIIHQLGQARHPVMFQQRRKIRRFQLRARSFHVRGWHATRGHDKHIKISAFGAFQHITDAGDAQHIGDLMRVGDYAGDAVRQDSARKFRWRHQAAFDMHMRVDQPGRDKRAVQINFMGAAIASAKPDDMPVMHRDVGRINLAADHIDQASIAQEQICRHIGAGRGQTVNNRHWHSSLLPAWD